MNNLPGLNFQLGEDIDALRDAVFEFAQTEIYLTPERLLRYTGGQWLTDCDPFLTFTGVGTYNTYSAGNLYFVLQIDDWLNEKLEVSTELNKILQKGVKAVVLDRPEYAKSLNIPVLLVDNAFAAFKLAAIQVRQELDCYTILVTGTEGKTGAKVQLHHLLKHQARTHAVINSANTEIPVLRSLINLGVGDQIEINEVSVGSDEDYRVERTKMVNPNICLFTNIGPNHMDMHKTMENLLRAKSSVVEGLRDGGVCIVNAANEYYAGLVGAIRERRPEVTMFTYGTDPQNHAYLESAAINQQRLGWDVVAVIEGDRLEYFLPLCQQHAPLMSIGILLTIKKAGYDIHQAARHYVDLQPFETMGRLLNIHKNGGEVLFYDQSRRGGIQGMRSAFNDLKNFKVTGKIVALVGGVSVKKDSDWTQEVHRQLAELINDSQIDRLYTTGNYMEYVHRHLQNKARLVRHVDDIDELADALMTEIQPGDLLFIIGSAYLYLGRVSDKLLSYKTVTNKPKRLAEDKFDRSIEQYALSADDLLQYRVLLVFEAIQSGVQVATACARYAIKEADYLQWHAHFANYREFRTTLLTHFFTALDKLVETEHIKNINKPIGDSGYKSYVQSQDYCHRWFNNHDQIKNEPVKQLFGNFYDFGHARYLLHIEVATKNLHIGLVEYRQQDDHYEIVKISEAGLVELQQEFPFPVTLKLQQRTWGLGWASVDCGNFIDPCEASTYYALTDLSNSPLYKTIIQPMVMALNH